MFEDLKNINLQAFDAINNGFHTLDSGAFIAYVVILVITIALAVAAVLLAPKPPSPKPSSLEDFSVPTADQERSIPVLFGTRIIKGPNTTWFGDLRADPKYNKSGKK